MRYIYGALLFILIALIWVAGVAHAELFTSKELIDGANYFNESKVTYKGEAITAIMKRGSYSWVNLNDGVNAIGVWCKSSSLEGIRYIGGYKKKGDLLEVEGIFHRACSMHGGELDIHADRIKIEAIGSQVEEHFSAKRIRGAAVFFILTLLALIFLRKRM